MLSIKHVDERGLGGALHTASQVRKVWILQLLKLGKCILKKYTRFKFFDNTRADQLTGSRSDEETYISYPFSSICVDLCGPYELNDCFTITTEECACGCFQMLVFQNMLLGYGFKLFNRKILANIQKILLYEVTLMKFNQNPERDWLLQTDNFRVFMFSIATVCRKNSFKERNQMEVCSRLRTLASSMCSKIIMFLWKNPTLCN